MKKDALVSIIIPAYNVEKYIFRGIESCMNQTYKNIEIVIVDDGSTDATWDIIEKYKKDDERIVAVHQNNAGVSAARNHALRVASGEYILFLDSDDWLEVETVQLLMDVIERSPNYLVCTECFFVQLENNGEMIRDQQGTKNNPDKFSREEALLFIGKANSLKLQSACYKLYCKDIIDNNKLLFDENIHHGEDGLFVFEYLSCMTGVVYEPYALWNILDRPGSATTSPYNPKWLTAITSVEKMLSHTGNSTRVQENLHVFLTERTLAIAIECIRADCANKNNIGLFRKVLKEHGSFLFKNKKDIKRCMQYLLILYAPVGMLKIILTKK